MDGGWDFLFCCDLLLVADCGSLIELLVMDKYIFDMNLDAIRDSNLQSTYVSHTLWIDY